LAFNLVDEADQSHDPSPSWTRRAVPLYGQLLVVDPSMSGVDEPDLRRVLEDADAAIVEGSRSRAAIKAGQDAAAIGFDISPGSTYRSTLSLTGRINATCWA
jgi:hypothetical protein